MVFSELRWNYSPLKEKAVQLPGGLFIFLVASRQTATDSLVCSQFSAPDANRSARKSASRGFFFALRSTPLRFLHVHYENAAPDAGRSASTGLAAISFR